MRSAVFSVSLALSVCTAWQSPTCAAVRRETAVVDRQVGEARSASTVERSQDERAIARRWGLSVEEYRRYETLMKGVRGSFSDPRISPIEVLGIHARTPEERRRYADRLVRLLYQDTERVLAFEREVQAAWRRLGAPMFQNEEDVSFPSDEELLRASKGRRLAVFTALSCRECQDKVRRLLALVDRLSGLDIYVVDAQDAKVIGDFAKGLGIRPDLVHERKVTLNRGRRLFSLYRGDKSLPVLFVRSGNRLLPFVDGGSR